MTRNGTGAGGQQLLQRLINAKELIIDDDEGAVLSEQLYHPAHPPNLKEHHCEGDRKNISASA